MDLKHLFPVLPLLYIFSFCRAQMEEIGSIASVFPELQRGQADLAVVVAYTEKCQPCIQTKKAISQYLQQTNGGGRVHFYTINAQTNLAEVSRYGPISGVPKIFVFRRESQVPVYVKEGALGNAMAVANMLSSFRPAGTPLSL
jgi:thiol-disulfide isomerase/thioredoxin